MDKEKVRDENIKKLGQLFREKRLSKNYSLRNVEDILKKKDITLSYGGIKKIEDGKVYNTDIRHLKAFAEIYNLSFEKVFNLAGIDLKELAKIVNLRENEQMKKIPLFGSASAGNGYINLDVEIGDFLIPEEDYENGCYAVKVVGNSMVGDDGNIPGGSTALIRPYNNEQIEIQEKKIYIFTYKDETYIKQLVIDKQKIMRLHSFNRDYEDVIILDPSQLICHGKVIKVYYRMEF